MRRKTLVCFLCIAALLMPTGAQGSSINDLKKKQEAAQSQKKDAQGALNSAKAQLGDVEGEVSELDVQLLVTTAELDAAAANLEETEARLAAAERELEEATARKDEQYAALLARVRFMYENGRLGYFEALFGSNSFADFLNNAQYVNQIVERDEDALREMRETEARITNAVAEIEQKKAEVSVLKRQLTEKQAALEAALAEKQAAMEALEQDAAKYEAQLKELEAASKDIEKLIKQKEAEEAARKAAEAKARAAAVSTAKYNGTFLWPAPSTTRITDNYGYRIHPITRKKEFHTGVDIGLAYGADIVAADKGEVTMSKYYGGYGYCVIISHGGGLSTLYGHCSKLLVKEGQTVSKGQVIAKCGSTGTATGPHLHFEVRVNGNHTSPKNYLNY